MFEIGFTDDLADMRALPTSRQAVGLIRIGTFRERFLVPLTYWSRENYVAQWEQGIRRLIAGSQVSSALIVSLTHPTRAHHLFWWLLYRVGDDVIIQNQMLIFEQLQSDLDLNNPYTHIRELQRFSEDGSKLSEWNLTFAQFGKYRVVK